MDSMVSICELSINVVMSNKPKMLTGLGQKACGQAGALRTRPTQRTHHRRRGATYLPRTLTPAERGKPVALPGRDPSRRNGSREATGWGSG